MTTIHRARLPNRFLAVISGSGRLDDAESTAAYTTLSDGTFQNLIFSIHAVFVELHTVSCEKSCQDLLTDEVFFRQTRVLLLTLFLRSPGDQGKNKSDTYPGLSKSQLSCTSSKIFSPLFFLRPCIRISADRGLGGDFSQLRSLYFAIKHTSTIGLGSRKGSALTKTLQMAPRYARYTGCPVHLGFASREIVLEKFFHPS